MTKEPNWLHVWAQGFEHDDAVIIGTAPALRALRAALDAVIRDEGGTTCAIDAMASDGEGYKVLVAVENAAAFEQEPVPYAAPRK